MQVVATVMYPHDEPPAPLPRAVEAMLGQHFSSVTAAKKAIRRREILVAGKVCNTSRYALPLPYVLAVMHHGHQPAAKHDRSSSHSRVKLITIPLCAFIPTLLQPYIHLTLCSSAYGECVCSRVTGLFSQGSAWNGCRGCKGANPWMYPRPLPTCRSANVSVHLIPLA